ncbi:MAG: NADPH-dependent glutamate synthase [Chloroflexota bacterium]
MPKVNLNRVAMPRQKPVERAKNFNEVALGYTPEMAQAEAERCLSCPRSPCVEGCPVGVAIPEFISTLREGNLAEAVRILKSRNALPGICGRVCPQETQCEAVCTLEGRGAPVAIGRLERFVADWERQHRSEVKAPSAPVSLSGKHIAVIGSGPASLTCAAELAMLGHGVTMYEALHIPGGVLTYGIPEFRLPKAIVSEEVAYVTSLGVQLRLDAVIGKSFTIDELLERHDAVFMGTGAGLPLFLHIEGENLNGIYSANEFLTRINLMKAYLFPEYDTPVKRGKHVSVIGGGNVAMDAARCALRLGAEDVTIVYRRSEAELPARREEVENAKEEGINFKFLTNPKRFTGTDKGWVTAMECYEMTLGEPDASGRRRPIVKPGSEFTIPTDVVVVALGTTPNPLIASTTPGLEVTSEGTVVCDEETGRTKKDRVWAGGDITTGAATVISAMGAGKKAAHDIDKALGGK